MSDRRASPQDLLNAVEKIDAQKSRGRLRVFLGMSPGVGKTYAMLKAAREQQHRGAKVLVGVVETHGRMETAELLESLTILPRMESNYKGTTVQEMDVDAILKAKPDLVLVDELAHTNAPGARHQKRFQDVEEILKAGIHVYTTLNIQHLESRNDQVTQITGIQVRETVPDSFLEQADQLEVIDLSPSELLQRLQDGKVYLGEMAERAAQNFFKVEHLTALRELVLRFTAEKVDQDLQDQMTLKGIEGPWNTNERLLVAVSQSPYSARLIRTTRRMAYNLEAPWVALYVDTGVEMSPDDQKMLQRNLQLARDLGAEVISVADTNLAAAIQSVCGQKNVTQVVMGRPDRRFVRDLVRGGTLLDELVRGVSQIDVHVIRATRPPRFFGWFAWIPRRTSGVWPYYLTFWFMAALSLGCYALLPFFGYQAIGFLFLLGILAVASFKRMGAIFLAGLMSALIWDFFFIPPQFTFIIRSEQDILMLVSYFLTALVAGFLTSHIRRQESMLRSREVRMGRLYDFGRELAKSSGQQEILQNLKSTVDDYFKIESSILIAEKSKLNPRHGAWVDQIQEKEFAVAQWVLENRKSAGWSTQTLSGSRALCLPLSGKESVLGVFLFYPSQQSKELTLEEMNFLETLFSQASSAIERFRLEELSQKARILEESEKLHQTLLNSVSHELRTPITTLITAAGALQERSVRESAEARQQLTKEIVTSAQRLDRVVENLLDVSRLDKGSLSLRREWFDVEDLIHETKLYLKDELKDRALILTGDLDALIEADFELLKHALANYILNALRYSEKEIHIQINREAKQVLIQVIDSGPGLKEESEMVFEKFYRMPGTPAGGLGLGLAIVKSIVELHGGSVEARNRTDQSGSIFEMRIPVGAIPTALKGVGAE